MGTQIEIAKQIKEQKGDYVLTLKRNQPNLFQDVEEYFAEPKFLEVIRQAGNYKQTMEKAIRGHWAIESMHWHLDVTF